MVCQYYRSESGWFYIPNLVGFIPVQVLGMGYGFGEEFGWLWTENGVFPYPFPSIITIGFISTGTTSKTWFFTIMKWAIGRKLPSPPTSLRRITDENASIL